MIEIAAPVLAILGGVVGAVAAWAVDDWRRGRWSRRRRRKRNA